MQHNLYWIGPYAKFLESVALTWPVRTDIGDLFDYVEDSLATDLVANLNE